MLLRVFLRSYKFFSSIVLDKHRSMSWISRASHFYP